MGAIDTLREWTNGTVCLDEDCVGCGREKRDESERDEALAEMEALLQAAEVVVEDDLYPDLADAVRRVKGDT